MQGGTRNCPGVHCKQKSVSPQLAAGCQPGEIQHRDVGRRNDEMHKAGQATGVPGFWLHLLQVLHGKKDFPCGLLTFGLVPRLRDAFVREMVPQ